MNAQNNSRRLPTFDIQPIIHELQVNWEAQKAAEQASNPGQRQSRAMMHARNDLAAASRDLAGAVEDPQEEPLPAYSAEDATAAPENPQSAVQMIEAARRADEIRRGQATAEEPPSYIRAVLATHDLEAITDMGDKIHDAYVELYQKMTAERRDSIRYPMLRQQCVLLDAWRKLINMKVDEYFGNLEDEE
ncbi:hypothetical protein AURDEDRAFT_121821 [Auricularia subglabra TFB-10046 SS5]|nr:hypothetical protein AURDEDRAFT_121821 [Auricularia subglabra TFB-10046 SS5]